jgi:hypothetical protein
MDTSLAQQQAFVNGAETGPVRPFLGGKSLAERVAEALLSEEYAFCREFAVDAHTDVWGCYKADDLDEPAYALEVTDGQITRCNCPDHRCRRRICKHQILLMLGANLGIKAPCLPPVALASQRRVFHAPRPVAQCIEASAGIADAAGGLCPAPPAETPSLRSRAEALAERYMEMARAA